MGLAWLGLLLLACGGGAPASGHESEVGVACAVEATVPLLAWEAARLGAPSVQQLEVRNGCDERVDVGVLVLGDDAFAASVETIALHGTSPLDIAFTPQDGDVHEATLFLDPSGGRGDEVRLVGRAETDWDGDGFADIRAGGRDCDDQDAGVHPGAEERCNRVDDDCDGVIDDAPHDWYPDADGDRWGAGTPVEAGCTGPEGYAARSGDCDDHDATVHPGAEDPACDGVDQDCDGDPGPAAVIGADEYDLIQEALDWSSAGDTVEICPGIWTETLRLVDADLTLTSHSGDAADTVLDGEGSHPILVVEDSTLHLADLTFTRGYEVTSLGPHIGGAGGAFHATDSEVHVTGCAFTDNQAGYEGGAVYLGYASGAVDEGSIRESTFVGNSAGQAGGGVHISHGHYQGLEVVVADSTFEDGDAYYGGAVAWEGGGGTLRVEDCTFTANHAAYAGGAISTSGADPTTLVIQGGLFDANTADVDGGAVDVGSGAEGDLVSIADTSFVGNEAATHGGAISVGTWGWAELSVETSSFTGNVSGHSSGAVELGGWATSLSARFVETRFGGNQAQADSSTVGVARNVEFCSIAFEECTLVSNDTSATEGAAVMLPDTCDLKSTDTDWGSGSSDNSPYDLCADEGCDATLGTGETFTCTAGDCS